MNIYHFFDLGQDHTDNISDLNELMNFFKSINHCLQLITNCLKFPKRIWA
jgi:hypothetical protein